MALVEPGSASSLLDKLRKLQPSSQDAVEFLKHCLSDSAYASLISSLNGDEMLAFIDFLDQALASSHKDAQLLEKGHPVLRKLCGRSRLLPSSHTLTKESIKLGDVPFASGGFGDVWKGTYDGRPVAIKVLRVYLSSTQEAMEALRKQFCKEVVTWKRLSHPNIVQFLGVSASISPFAMVSEWMPQGNVREYVVANSDTNRPRLLVDIATGLYYLHSMNIVHGDLKGENVLVDADGSARLCDFGFASFAVTLNVSTSAEGSCGTARWTAPELYDTGDAGHEFNVRPSKASDIYALSMIVMEIFTGELPFQKLRKEAVIFNAAKGKRPNRPDAQKLGLSDDLWEMTQQCWQKEPEKRPTIVSILEHLRNANKEFSRYYLASSDPTSKETIEELLRVLTFERHTLYRLRGQDAQNIIESINQAMSSPHANAELCEKGFPVLRKLCGITGLLPSSYIITDGLMKLGDLPFAQGGFGDVWKGTYSNQLVAVKVMRVYRAADSDIARKNLCREAVTWMQLSHPNIVHFYGVYNDIFPSLVSEWMPGGHVKEYVLENPEANRLEILVDVASGLSYLHSLNIVYGGMKGDNVLIDNAGRARLCDFGEVSLIETSNESVTASNPRGTLRWMAPELLLAEDGESNRATFSSDIYGLAMLVIEVFTGSVPFADRPTNTVIILTMQGVRPARPRNSLYLGLSDTIWEMVQACWDANQDRRPSISVVLDCFREAAGHASLNDLLSRSVHQHSDPIEDTQASESDGVSSLLPPMSAVKIEDSSSSMLSRTSDRQMEDGASSLVSSSKVMFGKSTRRKSSYLDKISQMFRRRSQK